MMDTVLSILVLASIAMLGGAFLLWRKGGPRKQIVLMVILAGVMAANVAIWSIPGPGEFGKAPDPEAGSRP